MLKLALQPAEILAATLELEPLRHNVPDVPQLDRLLIERTLNQLERLQRMRLGRL
jgi:hypothetical protein